MDNKHCRQCEQAYTEGADGYCQECLRKTQADMLKQWNNLNEPEE
jgi:hypothetical protein